MISPDPVKTCRRGHPQVGDTVRYNSKGYGTCMICKREVQKRNRELYKKPTGYRHIVDQRVTRD